MTKGILQQETRQHRELVRSILDGSSSMVPEIDELTISSWKRCQDKYGLDPDDEPAPVIIDREDLHERQQKYRPLLEIARPEMANLYQQLAGSGHAIMLTDADGVLMNYIGDPQFTETAVGAGMQTGAVWSEAAQGTNGMGTCLVEQKPLVIHKQAHYFARNSGLTCAAAPIFDPHGRILAVLDASSTSEMAQQHTMVLLNMSAQVIENRAFFCSMKDAFILRFHARSEFIGTLGEGAIAFDLDGRVIAVNRSAIFQLGKEAPGQIVGHFLQELFSIALPTLLKRTHTHPFSVREAKGGGRFFATLQPPVGSCSGPRPSSPRAKSPLIEDSKDNMPDPNPLNALHFGDSQLAKNITVALRLIEKDIPCMLFGETGTGKDMFARAIHQASSRRDKPFVAVNCASLPESLIESELFGYRPGAFTGASREGSRGKIVQANGGTLFLDEIGDMPLHLQARLLRVLEEREVIPLGGEKPIKVSIKLISATHHDIRKLVAEGGFREDLYYRLHGISLTMPPLRERRDKLELIRKIACTEAGTEALDWEEEALNILENYEWPGNIRQLRNVMRTLTALCDDNCIRVRDLPEEICTAVNNEILSGDPEFNFNALAAAERDALLQELEEMHWNISRVAKKLKLSRNTLYRRMKRYGITPPR